MRGGCTILKPPEYIVAWDRDMLGNKHVIIAACLSKLCRILDNNHINNNININHIDNDTFAVNYFWKKTLSQIFDRIPNRSLFNITIALQPSLHSLVQS